MLIAGPAGANLVEVVVIDDVAFLIVVLVDVFPAA